MGYLNFVFKCLLFFFSVENFDFCRFHWASDRFEELLEPAEEEPRFLLPRQRKGFVVFFNNLEDSTRARNCIKRY